MEQFVGRASPLYRCCCRESNDRGRSLTLVVLVKLLMYLLFFIAVVVVVVVVNSVVYNFGENGENVVKRTRNILHVSVG